jgi:thymidine kinase
MPGRLKTIVGPMGSGKTKHLIRDVAEAEKQGYKIHVFKHITDTRDKGEECSSRNGSKIPAKIIANTCDINLDHALGKDPKRLIAFEEGQFFGRDVVHLIQLILRSTNHRVIVTGLNMDFRGEPFGYMPQLMAMSHQLEFLYGDCDICKARASHTQRLIDGKPATLASPLIMIGGDELYVARCPEHFVPPC